MKVAIPIFGPRVSPRFDCAPSLLLFSLENGRVTEYEELPLVSWDPWQRVEKLKELNIQALICGGIDGQSAQMLMNYRIQVIPWVAGEAEEALEAFLKGKLEPGLALYPRRCRRRYRWQRNCNRREKIKR